MALLCELMPTYSALRTSDEEVRPQRSSGRRLIVLGFFSLGAFYLSMGMRSAASSSMIRQYLPSGSSLASAEEHSLRDENARLKAALAAAEERVRAKDAEGLRKMASFAQAPPSASSLRVSDNDFMKGIMSGLVETAAQPADSKREVTAPATPVPKTHQAQHPKAPLRPDMSADAKPSAAVVDTAPADPAAYKLTSELIRSRCDKYNIILVTFVNSKRADYAFTWASHLKKLMLSNYLVGAMDSAALQKLVARQIPAFDMESGLATDDLGWGGPAFRQLGLRKTQLSA